MTDPDVSRETCSWACQAPRAEHWGDPTKPHACDQELGHMLGFPYAHGCSGYRPRAQRCGHCGMASQPGEQSWKTLGDPRYCAELHTADWEPTV
jgi:hypothetical protein